MIPVPTEAQEQEALCRWLDYNGYVYFAVPNGGSRNPLEGKNLKKQGVKKGVSDLIVFLKNKILFIELKRRKKSLSKTSPEQLKFIDHIKKYDYADGAICYGMPAAREFIESLS